MLQLCTIMWGWLNLLDHFVAKIAEKSGLNRESLYKAMKEDAHPRFDTVTRVLNAMGLQLSLKIVPEKKVRANVVAEKRAKYKAK